MKCWLAEDQVEQASVIRLNDEEKEFFRWNAEKRGTNNGIFWIGPYPSSDKIRVPGCGRHHGNLTDIGMSTTIF